MVKTRKNRKNLKNCKRRNKRSNIKINGKPRIHKNHIEFDIEFIQKNMKKSRKINGGGDFMGEQCDATPLVDPTLSITDIVRVDDLEKVNLQLQGERLGFGTYNSVIYSTCKKKSLSHRMRHVLGVSPDEVVFRITCNALLDVNNIERYSRILNKNIIAEYNMQIELSKLGLSPDVYQVFLLDIASIRKLIESVPKLTEKELATLKPITTNIADPTSIFVVCAVIEKITTLGINISPLVMESIPNFLSNLAEKGYVCLDCKPDNIGLKTTSKFTSTYTTYNIVIFDLDSSFFCKIERLPLRKYMSQKDLELFCSNLMLFIFMCYMLINNYNELDQASIITKIEAITTTLYNFCGQDITFLNLVIIIYHLQDTVYTLFLHGIMFQEIIDSYVLSNVIELIQTFKDSINTTTTQEFKLGVHETMNKFERPDKRQKV